MWLKLSGNKVRDKAGDYPYNMMYREADSYHELG